MSYQFTKPVAIFSDFLTRSVRRGWTNNIPYLLYLAHSAFSIFKTALKMPSDFATQLAHSENENCLPYFFLRSHPMLFKAMTN